MGPEKPRGQTSLPDSLSWAGREILPTEPDIEANQPLLSRSSTSSSTLKGSSDAPSKPRSSVSENGNSIFASSWHFRVNPRIVSDAILGLSDGLTVPFALTAGLTALGDTRVVILGGLAELIAGAISMGLGGYVGAKSEMDSYYATDRSCNKMICNEPDAAKDYVEIYFKQFGLTDDDSKRLAEQIQASTPAFKDFLMQNHFQTTMPDTSRPYLSAITLGLGYFLGGFLPLIPYFIVPRDQVLLGLLWSIALMGVVLLVFGYVKTGVVRGWSGRENTQACVGGALQMLVVGVMAAGAAVLLVRAINGSAG